MSQAPLPQPPGGPEQPNFAAALELAHHLVVQGQPLQALKVVAELLRAAGLEREAGESVCRVTQALAAGSPSAQAANELAGLLSLISLQAQPTQQQYQQPQYQPQHLQQQQPHQQQSQQPGGVAGMDMDVEGGTGPGPPVPAASPADDASSAAARLAELTAAAEGASFVCQHCGGLVAVARQAAHVQLWCPALHSSG